MRKIVGRPAEDSYVKEDWVACACGKERWFQIREASEELVNLMWRLYEHSMCRTCELLIGQKLNRCPEGMPIEGGFSACGLTFAHKGRCQPMFTDEERQEQLKLLKEHVKKTTNPIP